MMPSPYHMLTLALTLDLALTIILTLTQVGSALGLLCAHDRTIRELVRRADDGRQPRV
mgnify:CR=1 FL=1